MESPEITKSEIIVVGSIGEDSYGNLTFTDKAGNNYKVSEKRKKYFEKVIVPDMAVQLNYAMAYGKEYIYSATGAKDNLPPLMNNLPPPTKPPEVKVKTEATEADEIQEVIKTSTKPRGEAVASSTMTKGDWDEKDRRTRKSIERQKSLELATEVAKLFALTSTEKLLKIAREFEHYLENG